MHVIKLDGYNATTENEMILSPEMDEELYNGKGEDENE